MILKELPNCRLRNNYLVGTRHAFYMVSNKEEKKIEAKQNETSPQNNFNMLTVLFSKEDPRLKIPAHLRRKTSLDPVDLGPLPVSI